MRRRLFPLFLLLSVCAFSAAAQPGPKVIESESKLVFGEKTARFTLVAENPKGPNIYQYSVEIVDTKGKVVAKADNKGGIALVRQKRAYRIDFPYGDTLKTASDELAWYRLRYDVGGTSGLISLSEILADDFELRVAAAENIVPGETYVARLRAVHSYRDEPISNVNVTATLKLDFDLTDEEQDRDDAEYEREIKVAGRTDRKGYLELRFKIPEGKKVEDADLLIRGIKGGIVREMDENVYDDDSRDASVLLTTDKPLYQPGQGFSVRALFLDANNLVLTNKELEISIEDGDDTLLYRQKVTTSAFGIASVSWNIPSNAKLGTYRVIVRSDDEDIESDELTFKVSRYDLPNFAVSAKSDKTFYLPTDEKAKIEISGDYLFGKPVPNGKVRVVRQKERKWNWQEQKYDLVEENPVEGIADANGKFTATLETKEDFADLLGKSWTRYEDIDYAAYVTDPSTNRTEQKRFRLRLSKQAIHVYTARPSYSHPEHPTDVFINTFYADGSPASCDVTLTLKEATAREPVIRLRTNSYGIAKTQLRIPAQSAEENEIKYDIAAKDRKGLTGETDLDLYYRRRDLMQATTTRTILKPGDPIELSFISTKNNVVVYVDLVKENSVLETQLVAIKDGKARLLIPYRPEFSGELTIGAYTDAASSYYWDDRMRSSLGLIYPQEDGLNVKAKFSNATYKPGEDAKVSFSVLDGRGSPSESALGIVVFDKAVEQRARTDEDFGSYFGRYGRYLGYTRNVGDITLRDLNKIDTSKPISDDMQLVAELMLANNGYYPEVYREGGNSTSASGAYSSYFLEQLAGFDELVKKHFREKDQFASTENEFAAVLSANGIDWNTIRDPWGSSYYLEFPIDRLSAGNWIRSPGPNKVRGDNDDIPVRNISVNYFENRATRIEQAVNKYVNDHGTAVRTREDFDKALAGADIPQSFLNDRWGRPARIVFETSGRFQLIRLWSPGADGKRDPVGRFGDDFILQSIYHLYFREDEARINQILNEKINVQKAAFPKTVEEFRDLLRTGGLDPDKIADGSGKPIRIQMTETPRYTDRVSYVDGKSVVTPVTDVLRTFKLYPNISSPDYATLITEYSSIMTESLGAIIGSRSSIRNTYYARGSGAISGMILDSQGAVVPGAKITVTNEATAQVRETTSSGDGAFLVADLPSGKYGVRVDSSGFKSMVRTSVEVRSENMVTMTVTLEAGDVSAVVEVSSGEASFLVNTTDASMSKTVTKSAGVSIAMPKTDQMSTPRLREFFPETLYWQPELITDKKGRAEATFKMADNITTWKMYTIASTKKGKIGVSETEVTAFQPFFVDLDPPKFLTTGDEIFLPTQVRNYTEKKQNVNVTMSLANWFDFLGCDGKRTSVSVPASCDTNGMKQTTSVASGSSENAVFGFKAKVPVKEGKQRVTAIAQGDSDAIERPVTVRPDGREIVHTESRYFDSHGHFDVNFPANALANSSTAELKIYPNLLSHVAESVDGLLRRPYGCGEQTISSTYPNLMILKFAGGTEGGPRRISEATEKKARKFLLAGYERLLGYQVADGGFGYWGGKDSADFALTAYALRFLADASKFIDVDEDVVKKAETFLIKQQRADGSWGHKYQWENVEDAKRTKTTTTYVARVLASLHRVNSPNISKGSGDDAKTASLTKALAYLKQRNDEIDDPYSLALLGLAAHDSGDAQLAADTAKTIRSLARDEAGGVYWNLESNTAFNGWGTAGRVETTALATQLLMKTKADPEMASRAMVFMLKNKDRYGVWYSTQTTINVLDTFVAAMENAAEAGTQTLDVIVNGTKIQTLEIGPDKLDQIIVPLDGKLAATANTIELRSTTKGSPLMAQVVANHYIDWRDADSTGRTVNQSRALELEYTCDKTDTSVMNEISCTVKAERVGYRGYGMLLAEIGTPPGADVSRESLQAAMDADYSISRYDILPDRIVVYMWSKPGGTKLNFKFRPRYGINAQTPASTVYDYYNPEAQATVAPLRFTVK